MADAHARHLAGQVEKHHNIFVGTGDAPARAKSVAALLFARVKRRRRGCAPPGPISRLSDSLFHKCNHATARESAARERTGMTVPLAGWPPRLRQQICSRDAAAVDADDSATRHRGSAVSENRTSVGDRLTFVALSCRLRLVKLASRLQVDSPFIKLATFDRVVTAQRCNTNSEPCPAAPACRGIIVCACFQLSSHTISRVRNATSPPSRQLGRRRPPRRPPRPYDYLLRY